MSASPTSLPKETVRRDGSELDIELTEKEDPLENTLAAMSVAKKRILLAVFTSAACIDNIGFNALLTITETIATDLGLKGGNMVWVVTAYGMTFASRLVVHMYPEERQQQKSLALIGYVTCVLGPVSVILGALFNLANWRWLFRFIAILAGIAFVVALILLPWRTKTHVPPSRHSKLKRMDLLGLSAMTAALLLLNLSLTILNIADDYITFSQAYSLFVLGICSTWIIELLSSRAASFPASGWRPSFTNCLAFLAVNNQIFAITPPEASGVAGAVLQVCLNIGGLLGITVQAGLYSAVNNNIADWRGMQYSLYFNTAWIGLSLLAFMIFYRRTVEEKGVMGDVESEQTLSGSTTGGSMKAMTRDGEKTH
ncbi:hypothetical protein QFC22_005831 [Naganishia vaughanmartiniae]|uniref:Uncharacterized protein n=1 Tax=Naganishia vaughanmartiniae TaxID=1424756 RepID=A0ACC2WT74_9TREE|nr:hypothetical protein QFC22_005831 [Naganishia vaughanmartiniae]